jgi:hypothetical protein
VPLSCGPFILKIFGAGLIRIRTFLHDDRGKQKKPCGVDILDGETDNT